MNYGFVIDNRLCIGCHACTVACKSEHNVPIGVNRTHVKYIEGGEFPNTFREFSVHRCNHCANAPCVDICPTTALYDRADGIVDFDNDRCIGCKSCMQACPYDALYIDPETNTAAKCNYCAHKIDSHYEPACVIVCPVEAIISGDLNDEKSKISNLVDQQETLVRKPEKGTVPNLYYVNGSQTMLDPNATEKSNSYLFSEQSTGVGHFSEYAENRKNKADMDSLLVQMAIENSSRTETPIDERAVDMVSKEIRNQVNNKDTKRIYDSPNKGVLWGWEVPSYVWTKALSAGTFFMYALSKLLNVGINNLIEFKVLLFSLVFMGLTGVLLIMDLDRPDRFLYVLLRPQWKSWLVRGAYIITVFGFILFLSFITNIYGYSNNILLYPGLLFALLTSTYTAFLFRQAKARDFWQSPWFSAAHMFIHSIMAGSIVLMLLAGKSIFFLQNIFQLSLLLNLVMVFKEIIFYKETPDNIRTVELITSGYYSKFFWLGIIIGNIMPLGILLIFSSNWFFISGALALIGIFLTEFVRIRVPQLIPLS